MIKTEITEKGLVHSWTDLDYTILLQTDTGIRYGSEVYDINPCPHTYTESPMTDKERYAVDLEMAEAEQNI